MFVRINASSPKGGLDRFLSSFLLLHTYLSVFLILTRRSSSDFSTKKKIMRFSITAALIAASTVALFSQVSAALTEQEKADIREMDGDSANLCPPCLQKAMHNHFPHACEQGLDTGRVRPEGATDSEEHCVCVSFMDLHWMKADCSAECPYVFNEKTMAFFLPSSKIEGCDKWIDFETGMEKPVKGHFAKDPNYKPEVYEIADPPVIDQSLLAEDDDDSRPYDVSVKVTTEESDAKLKAEKEEKERLELESGLKVEPVAAQEAEPVAAKETEADKPKDEL